MTLSASVADRVNEGYTNSIYNKDAFGFKDITNTEDTLNNDNNSIDNKEELVLFLERSYSYLDSKQAKRANDEIIQLAQQKAKEMGVKLVISSNYDDIFKCDGYLDKFK